MIARHFIERPVLASVLSILIVLAGLMALRMLPVQQYPQIVPPQVVVSASYSGATAEAASQAVAAPLELYINGVENMLYMTSSADDTGSVSLTVVFAVGTDVDQAAIDVEAQVQRAYSRLPEEVQRSGVEIRKQSSAILKIISLSSPDGSRDALFLNNYATLTVQDELSRVDGVAQVTFFGSKTYSMRIWLLPDQLADYGLTPADVRAAVNEQNNMFAAGRFGDAPNPGNPQELTLPIGTEGRFSSVEQFEEIILRSDPGGSVVRLRDVARVELGASNYDFDAVQNGETVVSMGIFLRPGANALEVSEEVDKVMARMSQSFPSGVTYSTSFDTTDFVKVSIQQVVLTLFQALLLVMGVIYLFLQRWRATLIPLLSIPVALIGAFAGMFVFGFSVNLLTLLAMVLAIGIVVDDAIVVLENVERLMREKGLTPKQAAIEAMEEVSIPIVTMVLVLAAVFIPVAFLGGLAGVMYQQFALTIAVSVILSGFVALTLSPALCAQILKEKPEDPPQLLKRFNVWFEKATQKYTDGVRFMLKRTGMAFAIFVGLGLIAFGGISQLPGGLVPDEDQGYVLVSHQLPVGASLDRTREFSLAWNEELRTTESVSNTLTFMGYDLVGGGRKPNVGASFVTLDHWSDRNLRRNSSFKFAEAINEKGQAYREANITAFNPPPISGISTTGGLEAYLMAVMDGDNEALVERLNEVIAAANERPELQNVRTTLSMDIPRYVAHVDRERAKSSGVAITDIFATMSANFSRTTLNDFNYLGRAWRVYMMGESSFREGPHNLADVFVRSNSGEMIPLNSLVHLERTTGPDTVHRYNNRPAGRLLADPMPGYSSGQAMRAFEQVVADVVGDTYDYQLFWTGASRQERESGSAAPLAFGFGLLMVFLLLAAQYERWTLPLAVLTAIPFAVFGAVMATWMTGLQNNIYFQVGLLVLLGLSAKNAILIVEFAVLNRKRGMAVTAAAITACKQRFRPILMTSLAFILGAMPLAFSSGAGAAARQAVGVTVVGGMLVATFVSIFFIPVFYQWIEKTFLKRELAKKAGSK
ncbi:multidrug efflux RND transporter permease subunit [Aliidiomarina halalkaliphila]|uniref:Efflux pump membrane transporter n=1 Tax=Aliidiomarina halalkaliphila TaxID=2593535 RepID=A0A552X000_9GAMM|nr:multidrug efflux RND transporter permease subunit [Aliidiomarina halalkaliphila]TRW48334.1 multidrug efflux RND transporter permease subunit [Aliidiomarina halalkaliphila]